MIYGCTSLKWLPIFQSFVKATKHIHHTKLGTMVCMDSFEYELFKNYTLCLLCFAHRGSVLGQRNVPMAFVPFGMLCFRLCELCLLTWCMWQLCCYIYQAWGATTMCREWKGGDGTKTFEEHSSILSVEFISPRNFPASQSKPGDHSVNVYRSVCPENQT